MIVINRKEDFYDTDLPQFVYDKLAALLLIYETDSLDNHGGIIIAESEKEVNQYLSKSVEFSEKIICDNSISVWHFTVTANNSFCVEVYCFDSLLSEWSRKNLSEHSVRTVYADEFYL